MPRKTIFSGSKQASKQFRKMKQTVKKICKKKVKVVRTFSGEAWLAR